MAGETVVALAGGEDETQRPAPGIADHVELGGQTHLGNAPTPDPAPPFSARRLLVDADQSGVDLDDEFGV